MVLFLYYHNHFKTCLKGIAVDKNNEYLPWFVLSLIEILKELDLSEKKFEFDLYVQQYFLANKNCQVLSYEEVLNWFGF